MTGLADMMTAQLIERHNKLCPADERIASWKASKAKLVERIEKLGAAAPKPSAAAAAEGADGEPKATIGASVRALLLDPKLSYQDIVDLVRAAHPDAATTARNVASVACVLRRNGTEVPMRRGAKGAN